MCRKSNEDLRAYSDASSVPQYMIAKKFGVADSTFCRWMREEFSEEQKERYRAIVDELVTEQQGG